jgi:hypothetical protein
MGSARPLVIGTVTLCSVVLLAAFQPPGFEFPEEREHQETDDEHNHEEATKHDHPRVPAISENATPRAVGVFSLPS